MRSRTKVALGVTTALLTGACSSGAPELTEPLGEATAAFSYPTNLVSDGSFEHQTTTTAGGAWQGGTIETGPWVAHGTKDAFVEASSGWNPIQQWVGVQPFSHYRASVAVQTSSNLTDAYFSVRGASNFAVLNQVHFGATSGGWTTLTFEFDTANDASVLMYIGFWGDAPNTWLRVDDATMVYRPNLVPNASFENGTASWQLGGTASLETSGQHTGSASLTLAGTSGWSVAQQWVPVAARTRYHVSGWFQTTANATDCYFSVRGNPGQTTFDVINQVHFGALAGWQPLSFDFESGSNTSVLLYAGYWGPGAASSIQIDDITVADTGPQVTLIHSDDVVLNAFAAPFGVDEYVPNASGACLADTRVSFQHEILPPLPGLPADGFAELHLFSLDPFALATQLGGLTDTQIRAGDWDSIASQGYTVPDTVVVQFPTKATDDPSVPVNLDLTKQMFWPAGVDPSVASQTSCTPLGATSASAQGTVKTAIVYQRGLCSTDVAMDDLMAPVFQGFFSNFKSAVALDSLDSPAQIVYGRMFPVAADNDGTPQGGFLMSYHFTYTHAALGGDVWGTDRYLFSLPPAQNLGNGVVVPGGGIMLTPLEIAIHSTGGYSSFVQSDVHASLTTTLPAQFQSNLAQTHFIVPEGSSCNVASDCTSSAATVASQITLAKLQASGLPNATATDVLHLQCTAGSASACQAMGVAAGTTFAERWVCAAAPAFGGDNFCQLSITPARLNATPDHLNIVWFDAPDLNSAAYASYVAFGAAHPYVTGMCSSQPTATLSKYVDEGYPTVVFGQ